MLRTATERLAAELARPGAEAPDWGPLEWRVAMAAAVIHGISGLLAERLRWEGPALWRDFLADQRHQMRLREERIRAVLRAVDQEARREGVPVVGLKGSALLGLSVYAPGTRPMADIDLLVRPGDHVAALRLLGRLGYRPEVDSGRHLTLLPEDYVPSKRVPFGEHAEQSVKIELHTRVAERLPLREIDITDRILTPAATPGLNGYPDLAGLMRHLVLHAAGNMRMHSVRLMQMHDLALMSERLTESDWAALASAGGSATASASASGGTGAWWALPPLTFAQRHFPSSAIDAHRLRTFEADCRPWLKRHARRASLTDLSSSCAVILLMPGLAWARSPGEALRLARERFWISASQRRLGAQLRDSQTWLRDNAWVRMPRTLRALYWLAGRRPAPAAQFCVAQALDYRAP